MYTMGYCFCNQSSHSDVSTLWPAFVYYVSLVANEALYETYYYTPRNEVEGGYTGFTLFVRPSVRPSVRFFTYITWVKILHGIEYQRPSSLNMRILADHVTYSFLAFPKSIF